MCYIVDEFLFISLHQNMSLYWLCMVHSPFRMFKLHQTEDYGNCWSIQSDMFNVRNSGPDGGKFVFSTIVMVLLLPPFLIIITLLLTITTTSSSITTTIAHLVYSNCQTISVVYKLYERKVHSEKQDQHKAACSTHASMQTTHPSIIVLRFNSTP